MDGEWKSSLHGWSKTSSSTMPQPLRTGASGRGSSPTATDPCIAPMSMETIAPDLSQRSKQGKLIVEWLCGKSAVCTST